MPFVALEHDVHHAVVVNTDQITYIRQDNYGTALHFQSGEHIICPMDLDALVERLFGSNAAEILLNLGS